MKRIPLSGIGITVEVVVTGMQLEIRNTNVILQSHLERTFKDYDPMLEPRAPLTAQEYR
jgi:hypothetical protein